MNPIVGFLKETSRLSSVSFIFLIFAVGIVLLYGRRTAAWGRRWLTTAILGYWILSTPSGAWVISWPSAHLYRPLVSREEAHGAGAIVMLGGGTFSHMSGGVGLDDVGPSALRVIEAARLYRLLGDPLVIVSGGNTGKLDPPRPEAAAYRQAIVSLGVPASRVLVEDQSLTTYDEAIILKPILAARQIDLFVLVTAPTHMGRSLATFRAVGLDPIPSAAPLKGDTRTAFWTAIPNRESLSLSDTALYDDAAWVYYWSLGRLRPK